MFSSFSGIFLRLVISTLARRGKLLAEQSPRVQQDSEIFRFCWLLSKTILVQRVRIDLQSIYQYALYSTSPYISACMQLYEKTKPLLWRYKKAKISTSCKTDYYAFEARTAHAANENDIIVAGTRRVMRGSG